MHNISLTITSNFVNHYSLALALELKKYFNDFYFVVKEKLPEDRKQLGFNDLNDYNFVIKEYEQQDKVQELFDNSDVVITDYTYNKYVSNRLKQNKITFVDSERLFKDDNLIKTILRYAFYYNNYRKYKNSNLLCISAYAAVDYNKVGLFKDRAFKWGYFSKAIEYDIDKMINNKKKNSIIWAGRLIDWKHPDKAIKIAKRLKDNGYDFELNIIGNGEQESLLKDMIAYQNLSDCVHLLGSKSPDKVREYMEQSQIYLFTSDRGEGWGVVLNEAMNSGCACVASYSAGSTPFLIKDGENGLIYKDDNTDELYNKTKLLLNDNKLLDKIAKNGYETIINEYNPENAAKKFYKFVETMINKGDYSNLYSEDILSKAIKL